MNTKSFMDRLKYGKHTFMNGVETYAYVHKNPDGSEGGWVAESALVDETCHIAPTAEVYEYAQVHNGARILGEAEVRGFAQVRGAAVVDGDSIITDEALVEGTAFIDSTSLGGRSHVNYGVVNEEAFFDYLIQIDNVKVKVRKP